jgi:hypothetical protein
MGMPIFQEELEGDSQFTSWIGNQINNNECFDFDYTPNNADKLEINIEHHRLRFVFDSDERAWVKDAHFGDGLSRSAGADGYLTICE